MDNHTEQATNNTEQKQTDLTLTDHLNKKLLEAFKTALDTPGNTIPQTEPTDSVGNDDAWQK